MPSEILFLTLIVGLAGIIQGTVGFGFGLVTMSTIPLWMSPKEAVPIIALLSLLMCLYLAWKLQAHMVWQQIRPLTMGAFLGVPIGVTLFVQLDPTFLRFGLGLALLLVCFQQFLSKPRPINNQTSSSFWGIVTGVASGILGGAFNTGGPPALMYIGVQSWSKEQTMAVLQGFFLTTTSFQIILFIWNGTITLTEATLASKLAIPTILGIVIGQLLFHRINQQKFRSLLMVAIGILGCIMLIKSGDKMLFHLSRL